MSTTLKKVLFIALSLVTYLNAELQVIKKENSDSNTTLLVIAGIHGNEPGSYFAASMLATHYNIKSKNLWIVPNLNKNSIMANKRGINGDMNRKFSIIKNTDKDLEIVKDIKKLILSKQVSLILNLHDGHGFYRKKFQGSIFNPNAWGQTCVIDQCNLNKNQAFGDLNKTASTVKKNINKKLLKEHHAFDVRNTKTKFEDEQMQHSLTYFAVTNNKPAFAIESSKNLSTLSEKVYYQLLAIEEFMKIMNITYERSFTLDKDSIGEIIKKYGKLMINDNFLLNLHNIKKNLSFIPIKSTSNTFEFSHPLGNYQKKGGMYSIFIGNKKIVNLKPQYFKMASGCPEKIEVEVDGKRFSYDKATNIFVNDDFKVVRQKNIRVNVIGFSKKGIKNESGININKRSLIKKFSVDKENKAYRIEFYKDDKFCSMSTIFFK